MLQFRKRLYQFPYLLCGNSEFVNALPVEPELSACIEEVRQPQRSVSSDRAPSIQDAGYSIGRDCQLSSQSGKWRHDPLKPRFQ
jgi:hypothetical protein